MLRMVIDDDLQAAQPDHHSPRPETPAIDLFLQQLSFTSQGSLRSALFLETHGLSRDEAGSMVSLGRSSPYDSMVRQGTPPAAVPEERRAYYLDWLRILAIYSVVFYHCIQGLDWINLWVGTEKRHVMAYKSSSLQIGMPIFFHISGRAQAFSKPKEVITVMLERFIRLIIPFVFGMLVLVPFWQYCQLRDAPGDHPKMYFLWYVWFFQKDHYQFHVGWLWFLPALFVIGVFSAPVFAFAETRILKYAIVFVSLWIISSGLLISAGCPWQLLLVAILAPLGLGVLSWFIPFPPRNEEPTWCIKRWLAGQGCTVVVFLSQIGAICSFRYNDLTNLMKMVPACIFFFGFYIHGYFVQRWAVGNVDIVDMTLVDEAVENSEVFTARSQKMQTMKFFTAMWQLFVFWAMLVSVFFGMPVGEWEAELFPIYSAGYRDTPFFGIAHVCGTWALMGLVITWFQAYANKQVHPEIYKQATSSVMVVYMFHWVFIAPCCYWLCRDFGMLLGWWKIVNPLIVMGAGCCGPYFIHLLLIQFPKLKRLIAI